VFVNEETFQAERLRTAIATADGQATTANRPLSAPPTAPARTTTTVARRTTADAARRIATTAPTSPAGVGCAASLIRWAVLAIFLFYGYTALSRSPELRQVLSGMFRGGEVDFSPVLDRLRDALDLPPDTTGPRGGAATPAREPSPAVERSAASQDAQVYELGQPGVTAPLVTERVPARYTAEALRQGIQGTVVLRCIVEPDGTVSGATVTRSLDRRFGLDDQAVQALKRWHFQPGRRGGQAVRVATPVTITFTIRDRDGSR
jgi:TonB family protein